MRTGSNVHENVSMPPALGNLKLDIGGKHRNRLSPESRVVIGIQERLNDIDQIVMLTLFHEPTDFPEIGEVIT